MPSNVLFITAWVKHYSTFELSNKKHTETASKKLNLVHFNRKNQIEKKILLMKYWQNVKNVTKKHFYMVTTATKLIILVYMYLYFYNDCLEVKLH